MERRFPDDLQVALGLLRNLNGWTQQEFAEAAGVERSQISQFETGSRQPTAKTLSRLIEAAGISPPVFRAILGFLHRLRSGEQLDIQESTGSPALQEVALALERATAQVLERSRAHGRESLDQTALGQLCTESARAAATDAVRASDLAGLALRLAEQIEGAEGSRVQAFAWAHIGNARRVAGDLVEAEAAFLKARQLLEAGAETRSALEVRILDLEASLRRDQRRFLESLDLLESALGQVQTHSMKGRLFLSRAFTLEQMGEPEAALETLEGALPFLNRDSEPRDFCVLQFNRVVLLLQLSRTEEAMSLFPALRELVNQLGNELDQIRLRWLESRVNAAQGRQDKAIAALVWVKDQFAVRRNPYDAALASLELAVLYLEEGRPGEVKTLAEEMEPVFQSQGVHRETMAALRIFTEAAAREAVTLDLARRLVAYLERARHDPELRFRE